ncbi:MAG: SDR family oxidoreductase [Proteobacteria bacterium]|nr:SDR family oxidoreductase [Pseudomonadota bacterium]MBI3499221.1 SDR family oxidoreductase [Pseudomonadota bacterium]
MPSLAGRTALVIGAATGIGRAVSEIFAAEGAAVVVADHGHEDERARLVARLRERGADAIDIECDVREEALVAAAIHATLERFGKLDILVNNAGVGSAAQPFYEQDWGGWDRIFDINLKGVAYGMKHGLPPMLQRGYGRIVNTASQLAHKPAPFCGAYCASKAAVVALTVSVAMEVAEKGIAVNCVCPGPTDTAMWRASDPAWNAWKEAQLPIKRVGRPEEVAAAYAFLASEQASYMIGQSVSPNGGDVMW